MPTAYDIREISIPDIDDSELEPIVAAHNALRTERNPRHVDINTAEFRVFTTSPGSIRHHHVVSDGEGRPAGLLSLSYPDDRSNPRLLSLSIGVLPDHRRKGIATEMLGLAAATARDLSRTLLSGETFDTVPASGAFAEAVGARKTLDMHYNVVRLADLDRDMLQEWERDGPRRAPGYSVMVMEGMYPDDLLVGMAHLYFILERDAPTPESWEPREYTPELVRGWVGNFLKRMDLITAIAIEEATGTPVGMSQLSRRHSNPTTWWVTTTMVDPDHRGHALGKWVKAAGCLEALGRWPGAVWMETGNAFTNKAMLGINHAMGFEHEFTISEVEIPVDEAEAYLTSRSER